MINYYLRIETNYDVILSVEFLRSERHRGIVQSLHTLLLSTIIYCFFTWTLPEFDIALTLPLAVHLNIAFVVIA